MVHLSDLGGELVGRRFVVNKKVRTSGDSKRVNYTQKRLKEKVEIKQKEEELLRARVTANLKIALEKRGEN